MILFYAVGSFRVGYELQDFFWFSKTSLKSKTDLAKKDLVSFEIPRQNYSKRKTYYAKRNFW